MAAPPLLKYSQVVDAVSGDSGVTCGSIPTAAAAAATAATATVATTAI